MENLLFVQSHYQNRIENGLLRFVLPPPALITERMFAMINSFEIGIVGFTTLKKKKNRKFAQELRFFADTEDTHVRVHTPTIISHYT